MDSVTMSYKIGLNKFKTKKSITVA